MGKFNGSSDDNMYISILCKKCVHYNEEYSCPTLLTQQIYSNKESGDKNSILNEIIPITSTTEDEGTSVDGTNGRCSFFVHDTFS